MCVVIVRVKLTVADGNSDMCVVVVWVKLTIHGGNSDMCVVVQVKFTMPGGNCLT